MWTTLSFVCAAHPSTVVLLLPTSPLAPHITDNCSGVGGTLRFSVPFTRAGWLSAVPWTLKIQLAQTHHRHGAWRPKLPETFTQLSANNMDLFVLPPEKHSFIELSPSNFQLFDWISHLHASRALHGHGYCRTSESQKPLIHLGNLGFILLSANKRTKKQPLVSHWLSII